MNFREAGFFIGGAVAAAVVTAGVAAWGSTPQHYRISCRPNVELAIKAFAVCSVSQSTRFWRFDSGEYLHADVQYPGWQEALGEKCAAKYQEYKLVVERVQREEPDYWEAAAKTPYFNCYNMMDG
jgi:hypothetical protein